MKLDPRWLITIVGLILLKPWISTGMSEGIPAEWLSCRNDKAHVLIHPTNESKELIEAFYEGDCQVGSGYLTLKRKGDNNEIIEWDSNL